MSSKQFIPVVFKSKVWDYTFADKEFGRCCCCLKSEVLKTSFHCGHIFAEAKGGGLHTLNMLPICKLCNQHMGQQYMPDYVEKHFGRNIFDEMKPDMVMYQKKIKNVLEYEKKVGNTPEAFLQSIEPVFEYLITNGYIQTTKEAYKTRQAAYESRNSTGEKEKINLDNITVDGILWKTLYVSYLRSYEETYFKFTQASTEEFPEYEWDGWVYLEKASHHRHLRKLTNYNLYIDRYMNGCYWSQYE